MSRIRFAALLLLAAALGSCTLPGAELPTPFTFPTPNLTHTAIFQPQPTDTPPPPTLEIPTATPGASATSPGPTVVTPAATFGPTTGRPNGSPVTAEFLASAPVIDGDLAEWTLGAYSSDQITYGASYWTGASDASATYRIGWDNSYLYLGVQVKDERFVQIASGRYLYRGDSMEILLDTDLAGDYYTAYLSADDYQLGLTPGNFGTLSPAAYLWYPASLEGARTTVNVASRSLSDGWALEARIPWSVFSVTPAGGNRYGFALSISDDDQTGVAVQQSMVSSVSTRRLTNPTTWGTLILGSPGGS